MVNFMVLCAEFKYSYHFVILCLRVPRRRIYHLYILTIFCFFVIVRDQPLFLFAHECLHMMVLPEFPLQYPRFGDSSDH